MLKRLRNRKMSVIIHVIYKRKKNSYFTNRNSKQEAGKRRRDLKLFSDIPLLHSSYLSLDFGLLVVTPV
jgi:hypothetical protein